MKGKSYIWYIINAVWRLQAEEIGRTMQDIFLGEETVSTQVYIISLWLYKNETEQSL